MKKAFVFTILLVISFLICAQAPQNISYQAIVRDGANNLVTNQTVGVQISILQGSASGSSVYVETHNSQSNVNGLISFEIGSGTVVSGDFSTIDWGDDSYFVQTEIDLAGATNYTITGTQQLLSVPYALYANTADTLRGGINETDPSVPTGIQSGEMQYWNGTEWITISAGNEGQVLTFLGGTPTWKTPAVGFIESGDVYNHKTGKIWMDKNLGAAQVATSSTDADSYGDLYQWGRASDGHQTMVWTSSTTSDGAEQANETTTLSSTDTPGHGDFITGSSDWRSTPNDNLWQGVSGTNNPCPSGYRLPTEAELDAERQSWSSDDAAGAFASPLKLPVAGYRVFGNGSLFNVGTSGFYWSSTVSSADSRTLSFNSSNAFMNTDSRAGGASVRCLKD